MRLKDAALLPFSAMLAEWFGRRVLDKRLEAHVERTYREVVDALVGGERDPEALEFLIAAHYDQLADAIAERSALVLSTYVLVGALDAIHQAVGAGETADGVVDRIAGYCCAVSGLDDAAFRKLFTQITTGDSQVAQDIADDTPTHVVLAAFAIEHQLRDVTTGRRFTIRHFIDTYNASDGPIYPPRHITHPPQPIEALYYLATAVLVGLCGAWLTVGNSPLVFDIAIGLVAAWLAVQAVVTYVRSRRPQ
ncbi:MAG: hypothetical protein PGN29_01190 [Gordonia paraffinivorans]